MVQCTPSVEARLHTCAWNTFRASSPTFHDLMRRGKADTMSLSYRHRCSVYYFSSMLTSLIFMSRQFASSTVAHLKHKLYPEAGRLSIWRFYTKHECVYVSEWVQRAGVSVHCCQGSVWWACTWAFLHMLVYVCLCEYEHWCTMHPSQWHMALLPPLWLVLWVSLQAGREGRPSLWLTQAERGFLHIFCHTIWALVSVATLLRTHLAAHRADGHLLFPASWWIEKTTTNRPCSLTLCCAYFTVAQCLCSCLLRQ